MPLWQRQYTTPMNVLSPSHKMTMGYPKTTLLLRTAIAHSWYILYVLSLRVVSLICLRCFYIYSGRWSIKCSRAASRVKGFNLSGAEWYGAVNQTSLSTCFVSVISACVFNFLSAIRRHTTDARPIVALFPAHDIECRRKKQVSRPFPSLPNFPLSSLSLAALTCSEPNSPVQICSTSPTCHPPTSPTSTESPADPSA